jgi:hypothetical protein
MWIRPARDVTSPARAYNCSACVYPQAAEAGGCLVTMRSGESAGRGADPGRAAAEAIRRARSKIRRYGVANRLNRLATLTYAGAGCHDPGELRRGVGAFFMALRPALGGEALPYVWVPEIHFDTGAVRDSVPAGGKRSARHREREEDWSKHRPCRSADSHVRPPGR